MRFEIRFEGKNGSRVHNWDPARSNMHEGSDKNLLEFPESSGNQVVVRDDKFINFQQT
jgi:hypothetical protein